MQHFLQCFNLVFAHIIDDDNIMSFNYFVSDSAIDISQLLIRLSREDKVEKKNIFLLLCLIKLH